MISRICSSEEEGEGASKGSSLSSGAGAWEVFSAAAETCSVSVSKGSNAAEGLALSSGSLSYSGSRQ